MTQQSREQMVDKIYEVIADKTLSLGCRIEMESKVKNKFMSGVIVQNIFGWVAILPAGGRITKKEALIGFRDRFTIIGHPVMIGDVLDWIEKKYKDMFKSNSETYVYNKCFFGINFWVNKRKPIEDQSIECITFIYNLLEK